MNPVICQCGCSLFVNVNALLLNEKMKTMAPHNMGFVCLKCHMPVDLEQLLRELEESNVP
jgi:hypothetical protein